MLAGDVSTQQYVYLFCQVILVLSAQTRPAHRPLPLAGYCMALHCVRLSITDAMLALGATFR